MDDDRPRRRGLTDPARVRVMTRGLPPCPTSPGHRVGGFFRKGKPVQKHGELIEKLIRIKDRLTIREERDAISEACNILAAKDRGAKS